METIGPAAPQFLRYVDLLCAQGYFECRDWPYAFGAFDNGVPIPDVARRLYQDLSDRQSTNSAIRFRPPGRAVIFDG